MATLIYPKKDGSKRFLRDSLSEILTRNVEVNLLSYEATHSHPAAQCPLLKAEGKAMIKQLFSEENVKKAGIKIAVAYMSCPKDTAVDRKGFFTIETDDPSAITNFGPMTVEAHGPDRAAGPDRAPPAGVSGDGPAAASGGAGLCPGPPGPRRLGDADPAGQVLGVRTPGPGGPGWGQEIPLLPGDAGGAEREGLGVHPGGLPAGRLKFE